MIHGLSRMPSPGGGVHQQELSAGKTMTPEAFALLADEQAGEYGKFVRVG